MQTRVPLLERAGAWPFLIAWLAASAILLIASWPSGSMAFPDPDDALRLQQVRDWIAGQSWYDVTQYRLNPPDGAPMHWSRLVDIPIAAMILAFRPLVGGAAAEVTAMLLAPLIMLGLVMALVARITRRLLDHEHALLAALLVPTSVAAMQQLRPFRIDHHGWQIALALLAVVAALDRRPLRSGVVAGTAAALWLQISLEGLPFAVAIAALFGMRWLADPNQGRRLAGFVGALAAASLLLFGLTRPFSTWPAVHCDAISAGYLAAIGAGAVGVLVAAHARLPFSGRLIASALAGAAALIALRMIAPQCAAGPFEALDPVVRDFWYERVREGLPLWRQSAQVAAVVIAFPVIGLIGGWRAWSGAEEELRRCWATLLFLLAAALLAALFVQRAGGLANMLALPGGVFLLQRALSRARTLPMARRLVGTFGALLLVTPSFAIGAMDAALTRAGSDAPQAEAVQDCANANALSRLRTLPVGRIAAPLDIAPALLVFTHHSAIASGHHRNGAAMRDVIEIFSGPYAGAEPLLRARGIDYIALCPNLIEPHLYRERGPDGLWARLASGQTPAWLEPIAVPGTPVRVWKVRRDR